MDNQFPSDEAPDLLSQNNSILHKSRRATKFFESSNHLGNVLSTFTDRRLGQTSSGNTSEYYEAEVVSATDYYPFGFEMPGRQITSDAYRFGFNGKEKDEEGEWGGLTHYDYGFRIYNPAIARFLSVDPLTASYPFYTPYQFAGNKPIIAIDLDGLEEKIVINSIYLKGVVHIVPGQPSIMYETETIELTDKDEDFWRYEDQKTFGERGTLTISTLYDVVEIDEKAFEAKAYPVDYTKILTGNELEDIVVFSGFANDKVMAIQFELSDWDSFLNKWGGGNHMKGGVMFALDYGQGMELRWSENADVGPDITLIMAAAGRAKSLGDVTEGGLGGMEGAINYLKESKGANKEIRDGVAEIGRLIEELQKKMSNPDIPQSQSSPDSFFCEKCRHLQDSSHLDRVNGKGTYQEEKEKQK